MPKQYPDKGGIENTPCDADRIKYRNWSDKYHRTFCLASVPCRHQAPSGLEEDKLGTFCDLAGPQQALVPEPKVRTEV